MNILKTLKKRDIIIGEGKPKVAVSVTGKTAEEIISIAKNIDPSLVDILEWRADYYDDVFIIENVLDILKELRNQTADMLIIFTFRTRSEGGEKDVELRYYIDLNKAVAKSKYVDLVDIEFFLDEVSVKETIQYIQKQGISVIGSNHDFRSTPSIEDIIKRAVTCKKLGADIIKLAFMPNTVEDVICLLSATNYIYKNIDKPVITMSMGKLGIISRISGETFGSSVTFAAMNKASAPGQMPVERLNSILKWI